MRNKRHNLRLKERVRAVELTPQQALGLLWATNDPYALESHTWGWLLKKGAKVEAIGAAAPEAPQVLPVEPDDVSQGDLS